MTKVLSKTMMKDISKGVKRTLSNTSLRAIALSLLFIFSGVGVSVLINPVSAHPNSASPSSAAPVAAASPLTQAQANWGAANGNGFNQNYNPQNQINSSNAQYLRMSWLFPLPIRPTALLTYAGAGGSGVDTAPMIINGTIYTITQYGQVFALNAANGNVLWNDVLPITLNSTAGITGISGVSLHLHDGSEQFTTKLFGGTPTLWYAVPGLKIYAIDALTGAYELNFTYFTGMSMIQGNSATSLESPIAPNILVDQNRGVAITSIGSTSSPATGRCFYRGWNILVNPPAPLWTAYCTPPQPGSNLPVNPYWDISQVNNMSSAQIFYPGPAYNGGGSIPSTAVVDLKTLSSSQLNSTLYNDWGYLGQSAQCAAYTGGSSTGSTAAGWGAPWLLGSGPTSGMAFVNTNNKDPYNSPCTPGPDLWSAAVLALNVTTGNWIWGFQATAHDIWDYDCSWWQAMGNETVSGANTQVLWKKCKDGYLYELNALTGKLIWAYTPPASILPRCTYCYMLNPLNSTQMNYAFMNPSLNKTLYFPSEFAGIENEGSYSPALNLVFIATQNVPLLAFYVAPNSSNYKTNSGMANFPPPGATANAGTQDNSTVTAVNAATGQSVWHHFISTQGYRGGLTNSGGIVFATLSSGDIQMLNATTGNLIQDLYIGGPINQIATIGATVTGQVEVIFPITAGLVSWGTAVPGDIVALSLQGQPASGAGSITTTTVVSTVTASGGAGSTSTTTVVSTSTSVSTSVSGGSSTALYGVAAVAVIFIIATGYLAMTRGRKPAS
jgi:outer membrane protein assembly factor BamB